MNQDIPYIEYQIPSIDHTVLPINTEQWLRERNRIVIARYRTNGGILEAYNDGYVTLLSYDGNRDYGYAPNYEAMFPRVGNQQHMKQKLYSYRSP